MRVCVRQREDTSHFSLFAGKGTTQSIESALTTTITWNIRLTPYDLITL